MDTRKLSRLTGAVCLVLAPAGFPLGFLEARYDQEAPGTAQLAERS